MAGRSTEPSVSRAWLGATLAMGGLFVVVLFFPMERVSWDVWAAVFVGPAVFFASRPAFARQARREGRPRIVTFLTLALGAKMLFSFFRWYHAFYVVQKADARAYDHVGGEMALRFLRGDFTTGLEGSFDTNFIRVLTGGLYTIIRPSSLAGFLIYAWLGFWGTYFFYRAFVLAVPDGDRRSYARWLFFMPSILFWPSSIGKESWLMFGLGIAAFGAAKVLTGRFAPGIVISVVGLSLAALVRAPIAVVFGVGLIIAAVIRRPHRGVRRMGPFAKVASIVVLGALGLALFVVMRRYLLRSGYAGLEDAIDQSADQTSTGGSEFSPVPINTPAGMATAALTVLFRPFFFEARTLEALLTSMEASLLLFLSIVRFGSFVTAVRNVRRIPYVLLAMVYVAGSIVALSPVANFGIIARQRVLIYPMFLVLICLRPRRKAEREPVRRGSSEAARPVAGLVGAER